MSNQNTNRNNRFRANAGNNRVEAPTTENLPSNVPAQEHPSGDQGMRNTRSQNRSHNTGSRYRVPRPNVGPAQNRGPPQPESLSHSNTPMRNDPLYEENYFLEPSCELRDKGSLRTYAPECTGITALVEASYRVIAANNQNFTRYVSQGMYQYYVTQLLLARILKVNYLNSFANSSEAFQFVSSIEEGKYKLPKLLSLYINGYGNYSLPCGRIIYLRLPNAFYTRLTSPITTDDSFILGGYYENIEDNPDLYSYLPSPGVAAQRIIEDILQSGTWDLPPPYAMSGHTITERTIGYRDTVNISPQMVQALEECRVYATSFEAVHEKFVYNPDLMSLVMTKLAATRDLTLHDINLSTPNGSLGQVITNVPIDINRRVGITNYEANSPARIPGAVSYIASTFIYRSSLIKDLRIVPVHFNTANVTFDALYNIIAAYHERDTKVLEHGEFSSVPFTQADRLTEMVRKDISRS